MAVGVDKLQLTVVPFHDGREGFPVTLPASNPLLRDSLWKVHGKKCLYCKRPKLPLDIEIDHVVPESIEDDLVKRELIAKTHGLAPDFNIQGYENFAPSCGPCNRDKSDNILPEGQLGIVLAKIAGKIPDLIDEINEYQAKTKVANIAILIHKAVQNKHLTMDELTNELKKRGLLNSEWRTEIKEGGFGFASPIGKYPRLVWDNEKSETNMHKHGISFSQIVDDFQAGVVVKMNSRHIYGEERSCMITASGYVVIYVVHADTVRVISARRASPTELNSVNHS